MNHGSKKSQLHRTNRIEGQVRGIAAMIEADRYCIDVVIQIRAARAALKRLEDQVLKTHVAHCVEGAILGGDHAEQRKKAEELLALIATMDG